MNRTLDPARYTGPGRRAAGMGVPGPPVHSYASADQSGVLLDWPFTLDSWLAPGESSAPFGFTLRFVALRADRCEVRFVFVRSALRVRHDRIDLGCVSAAQVAAVVVAVEHVRAELLVANGLRVAVGHCV